MMMIMMMMMMMMMMIMMMILSCCWWWWACKAIGVAEISPERTRSFRLKCWVLLGFLKLGTHSSRGYTVYPIGK